MEIARFARRMVDIGKVWVFWFVYRVLFRHPM